MEGEEQVRKKRRKTGREERKKGREGERKDVGRKEGHKEELRVICQ